MSLTFVIAVPYLLLIFLLTGCSSLVKDAAFLGEHLLADLTENEQKQMSKISDQDKAEIMKRLDDVEKRQNKKKHQESHITVHQYYLDKNHLSDAETQEIKEKIKKWQD